jgi:hypothetical protein
MVVQSGTAHAQKMHENQQARYDKKIANLQAKIEEVEAEKVADNEAFAVALPDVAVEVE